MKSISISRRRFLGKSLKTVTAAVGFPYTIQPSALGKNGSTAPSNRIVLGCIGTGWMGGANLQGFLGEGDCHVVAVCDIDRGHLNSAKNAVNAKYNNKDCSTYHDFYRLLERDDIDAVSIATPDHWHAIPAIASARSGKDIYCEKPMAHTLVEGRAICDAVKRYGRVWQTGSWQRSRNNFRFACDLVINGRIGKVSRAEVGLPSGHYDFAGTAGKTQLGPPPDVLDYDRWLGPAPYAPYCAARVHKNWRWHLDYGGGQLMDWIGHHNDIAHWGLGLDYEGPYEVDAYGQYPRDGLWNSPTKYRATCKYKKNDITIILAGGYRDIRGGTKWIGEDGWVWVNRGQIDAHPKNLLSEKIGPNEINLIRSDNHYRNFLDCVKSRAITIAPVEVAHRSVSPGHLANISMRLGRKIRFNPETEEIIGDKTASSMLGYAMRSPWHV